MVYRPEFKYSVGLHRVCEIKAINKIGPAYGVHQVRVGQ